VDKDEVQTAGDGSVAQMLCLGPRFHAEVGKRRLLLSFYPLAGRDVDRRASKILDEVKIFSRS
jgi:hypothetical protein